MTLRFSILMLALALSGCVEPNKPFWLKGTGDTASAVLPIEQNPDFYKHLAVIEIDEQGDLWSGKQIERAQRMIRGTKKWPLVFIYVPGWQNNARPSNKDLQTFSWYLSELSKIPRIAKEATVCGVYVGWRGATFTESTDRTGIGYVPRFLSFWSRLDATNRVAGVPLTRAIAQVVSATREHPVERGVSVLIGYSFGGRIVERTLGQSLVTQHAFSAEQDGAYLPADLTVLINSASESLYAREIKLALKDWKSPRPAVISITADTDLVTAYAWPFGQTFQHLFGGFRDYQRRGVKETQRSYVFSTAGHRPETFTHEVVGDLSVKLPPGETPFTYNADRATPEKFFIRRNDGDVEAFSLKTLNPTRPGALPVGGYWVVDVPPVILKGHGGIVQDGGIFSPQITELLAALLRMTYTDDIHATPRAHLDNSPQ